MMIPEYLFWALMVLCIPGAIMSLFGVWVSLQLLQMYWKKPRR